MKVLLACEESQRVCIEFRRLGHEAYSCDILPCSGGHPEWHIKDNVIELLKGNCVFETMDGISHCVNKWDMLLAFPPCTDLAVSGARHFELKRKDGRQRKSIEFFCRFLETDIEKVCIENPINIISGDYVRTYFPDLCLKYNLPIKASQIIQPWMFGDNVPKSTCLWLKGLPLLKAEIQEEPEMEYKEWIDKKGRKKRQALWYYDALKNKGQVGKLRSKTFPGVAKAMAEQWGKIVV